jgi:hypothetical protein
VQGTAHESCTRVPLCGDCRAVIFRLTID